MEKSNERQDLIAESVNLVVKNANDVREKLEDMMYSVLVRKSYYDYLVFENVSNGNSSFQMTGDPVNRKTANIYEELFWIVLSAYSALEDSEQNIDLEKLIENEIENYNFKSFIAQTGLINIKDLVKDIFGKFIKDKNRDVELYSSFLENDTMSMFINEQTPQDYENLTSWARLNLRAIFGHSATPKIEELKTDYEVDPIDYDENIVKNVESYNKACELANVVIREYNSLFSENGKIIQVLDGVKHVVQKYIECKPQFDLSILNKLINNAEEIKKENRVDKEIFDKMSLVSGRISTLRDCIVLERDLRPKFNDKYKVIKDNFVILKNSVKSQIYNISLKVRNFEQSETFERALLIISGCNKELLINVLNKLNNPDIDCINKFINNKNLHRFINENPDKVETLMWGFVNQPKIFFNDTVSYDAKIKIFDSQRNSPKESYNIYGKLVVSQKISELPAEYSNLVVMIWDRANFFNCNRIVGQLTQQLLAELYSVVKKFDLNVEETKKIVNYFYRHRAKYLNMNSNALRANELMDNLYELRTNLYKVCQDKWGFLTREQKEIINSRPEEERAKFREAMKDPRFREICVDETVAENLSCFLDDYQKYVDDTWFDSIIIILDEFDFGEDFYKGIRETEKKNYLRDIILFAYKKMMKTVEVNPVIHEKFKNSRDYQIALVKYLKNSLPKLREYMKKAVENGIEGGDAAEQLNSSNDFLPGIDKDNKEAIYVVAQNISAMIEGLENFRKSLSKPEEFNDKEKGIKKIYRNDFGFFLKYYPIEVANCFVNLSAENEYIDRVINAMKKNPAAYKTFKKEVIQKRHEIIISVFLDHSEDYKKFKEYLKNPNYVHSLIRHVNSPENTKTIYKLLETGLSDPSKVTTKDLKYTRELINDNLLNISEVVNYFNAGGTNLVEVPKDQVREIFDFLNSPELNSFEFIDRLKITKALFNKIDEIKKDPKVVKKFIDEVQDDKLNFAVNNLTNCMVENIKFICSNSSKYGKDSGNRQYSLKNVNLTDALIDICNNFYLGLFTKQSSQMLPVYIDAGELDKNIFNEVLDKHFVYISEDFSTREAAGSKLKKFYDNNKTNITEADREKYTYAIISLATPKAVFSSISHDYDIICNLHESENFREELSNLSGGNNLAFYINQNTKSPEAKQITKKLLEIDAISDEKAKDEKAKEIKSYVLKDIPQDLVNTCKDEIAIEKFGEASKEMAQAIAKAIIQNHPENAVEVAQRLGREDLIGSQLYQNDTISQVIDQQQINQEGTRTRPLSDVLNNAGNNNSKDNEVPELV